MTEPDDPNNRDDLQDYLRGDSKLSRAYRVAADEKPPPALDALILAQARLHARPRPNWSRVLTPYALAASVLLGVNLAWNVYQQQPLPPEAIVPLGPALAPRVPMSPASPASTEQEQRRPQAFPRPAPAPAAAASQPQPSAGNLAAAPAATREKAKEGTKEGAAADQGRAEPQRLEPAFARQAESVASDSAAADAAVAPELETEKIQRLIDYVEHLDGAVFIRNGREYSPAEAAGHLRLKWRQADDRVRTATDFIVLCVSRSPIAGEPYSIRFADGSTRPLADVLSEQLKNP